MIMKLDKGKGWAARAYWRDANGEKRSAYQGGFRTKAGAVAWEMEKIADMTGRGKDQEGGAPTSVTLSQLHDDYLERLGRRGSAPRTMEYYCMSGKAYLPYLGDMAVADITPLHVQQTVDAMGVRANGTPYRSATVRGFYRALRAVCNYGVTMGVITASPCRGIDLPKEQAHESVILTGADLANLLGALKAQEHVLYWPVSMCARYALRRGEALGVRWQDIDFEHGILHVRANLTCASGAVFLKNTKTRSSETTVALGDEFLAELTALREARQRMGLYKPGSVVVDGITPLAELRAAEFVCLDAAGHPFRPDGMYKRLHAFQAANNLPLSGWHDLRHSYGTLMAEAGVDVVTISKAMRHSSVSITSDQYITGTDRLKRNATDTMSAIISRP